MKTVFLPMKVAVNPPRADPMAIVAAVVDDEREFALNSASGCLIRFGIAARFATLKNADIENSDPLTT
jgi:hypothetical protein